MTDSVAHFVSAYMLFYSGTPRGVNGTPRGTPRAAAARNTPRSTPVRGGGGAKSVRSSPRVDINLANGESKKFVEAGCQTSPGFVAKVQDFDSILSAFA